MMDEAAFSFFGLVGHGKKYHSSRIDTVVR